MLKKNKFSMKFLRKFNEGKEPDQSEIYDLSKDYLAYLIDDDYSCDVHTGYEWSHTTDKIKSKLVTNINFFKYKNDWSDTPGKFLWSDVKDHFIPFIHLLSKDYNIDYFKFTWIGRQKGSMIPTLISSKRSLQQVLDDDNCDFELLERVTVVISKKE
jgi:hypothetical protein